MALILRRNGRWWSKIEVRNSSKLSRVCGVAPVFTRLRETASRTGSISNGFSQARGGDPRSYRRALSLVTTGVGATWWLCPTADGGGGAHGAASMMITTATSNGEGHVTDERGVHVYMADPVRAGLICLTAFREQLHGRIFRAHMTQDDISMAELAAVIEQPIRDLSIEGQSHLIACYCYSRLDHFSSHLREGTRSAAKSRSNTRRPAALQAITAWCSR